MEILALAQNSAAATAKPSLPEQARATQNDAATVIEKVARGRASRAATHERPEPTRDAIAPSLVLPAPKVDALPGPKAKRPDNGSSSAAEDDSLLVCSVPSSGVEKGKVDAQTAAGRRVWLPVVRALVSSSALLVTFVGGALLMHGMPADPRFYQYTLRATPWLLAAVISGLLVCIILGIPKEGVSGGLAVVRSLAGASSLLLLFIAIAVVLHNRPMPTVAPTVDAARADVDPIPMPLVLPHEHDAVVILAPSALPLVPSPEPSPGPTVAA